MNRSTWLIARAIWVAFAIVFLVFFGLELVFRVLDEAKLPHTNYTADEIALVSIFGMPRRLYLDLPLMVLIAVAAGLGGLAQSSELTILRAAGLSIRRIFLKVAIVLSPFLLVTVAFRGLFGSLQCSVELGCCDCSRRLQHDRQPGW